MNVCTDHVDDTIIGGAMDSDIVANSLIASGVVLGGAWSLGSTIHTLVSAPIASLGTLGLGTLATAGGVYVKFKPETLPIQTQAVEV